jgi:hypothetical protein
MPTVMRIDGARVTIFPNDHRPAHVHVVSASGEAVFLLNCPEGPVTLRESYGYRLAELNRLGAALSDALALLCQEWRRIHGD